MREIKFRAWDKVHKTMCEVKAMLFDLKVVRLHSYQGGEYELFMEYVILMQSTGLKDKNGKEIYEGDIFEDSLGWKAVVKWDKEGARFLGYDVRYEIGSKYISYIDKVPLPTVIGNLYENPELLE